jgi:hypothetical protein
MREGLGEFIFDSLYLMTEEIGACFFVPEGGPFLSARASQALPGQRRHLRLLTLAG